jgi:2-haloacid dehalogenase
VDFWTLTERALDYAMARVPSVHRALRPRLLEAYLKLDAFADVRSALAALKASGARLAILSNGAPRMLAAVVEAAELTALFDAVLSVHAVRVYKPRPEAYALVTHSLDIVAPEVAFVSSNRWDIMGAAAFGFKPLWLNRSRMPDEYPEHAPLRIIHDFGALLGADR